MSIHSPPENVLTPHNSSDQLPPFASDKNGNTVVACNGQQSTTHHRLSDDIDSVASSNFNPHNATTPTFGPSALDVCELNSPDESAGCDDTPSHGMIDVSCLSSRTTTRRSFLRVDERRRQRPPGGGRGGRGPGRGGVGGATDRASPRSSDICSDGTNNATTAASTLQHLVCSIDSTYSTGSIPFHWSRSNASSSSLNAESPVCTSSSSLVSVSRRRKPYQRHNNTQIPTNSNPRHHAAYKKTDGCSPSHHGSPSDAIFIGNNNECEISQKPQSVNSTTSKRVSPPYSPCGGEATNFVNTSPSSIRRRQSKFSLTNRPFGRMKKGHRSTASPKYITKSSIRVSYYLRHGAEKAGLAVRRDGFVRIVELLALKELRHLTLDDIIDIVRDNVKQRFLLAFDPDVTTRPTVGEQDHRCCEGEPHTAPASAPSCPDGQNSRDPSPSVRHSASVRSSSSENEERVQADMRRSLQSQRHQHELNASATEMMMSSFSVQGRESEAHSCCSSRATSSSSPSSESTPSQVCRDLCDLKSRRQQVPELSKPRAGPQLNNSISTSTPVKSVAPIPGLSRTESRSIAMVPVTCREEPNGEMKPLRFISLGKYFGEKLNEEDMSMILRDPGRLYIRAQQGHSMACVDPKLICRRVVSPSEIPVCVHGTFWKNWASIQQRGIYRMHRLQIHFASGLPGTFADTEVVSGVRRHSQLAIFIDVSTAMKDGIEFYQSGNGVILTEGDRGFIKPKYFLKVISLPDGKVVYSSPHNTT